MKCLYPNMITGENQQFKPFNESYFQKFPGNTFIIPCNRCFNCKINKSKVWAVRCLIESYDWKYNYFITLTYNDENLKYVEQSYIPLTGEFRRVPTLSKKDVQKFIKRLRRDIEYHRNGKLKYLIVGEYGDQTKRPHYHLILFMDVPISDLAFHKMNKDGDTLWTSKYLDSIWKHGNTLTGMFNIKTAAYTARYTMKKLYGDDKKIYVDSGLIKQTPEFMLCSKKPPIGFNYFNRNKKVLLKSDTLNYYQADKLQKIKIPKSFLKKLHESEIKQLMENRVIAAKREYINYKYVNKELNYLNLLIKERFIAFEKEKKLKQTTF